MTNMQACQLTNFLGCTSFKYMPLFLVSSLTKLQNKQPFFPCHVIQIILMFVSKAKSLPVERSTDLNHKYSNSLSYFSYFQN